MCEYLNQKMKNIHSHVHKFEFKVAPFKHIILHAGLVDVIAAVIVVFGHLPHNTKIIYILSLNLFFITKLAYTWTIC